MSAEQIADAIRDVLHAAPADRVSDWPLRRTGGPALPPRLPEPRRGPVMTRRVTEHVTDGHHYRITDYPDGPSTVEASTVEASGADGWCLLRGDQAAAVLYRIRTGRPWPDSPGEGT